MCHQTLKLVVGQAWGVLSYEEYGMETVQGPVHRPSIVQVLHSPTYSSTFPWVIVSEWYVDRPPVGGMWPLTILVRYCSKWTNITCCGRGQEANIAWGKCYISLSPHPRAIFVVHERKHQRCAHQGCFPSIPTHSMCTWRYVIGGPAALLAQGLCLYAYTHIADRVNA